MTRNGHSVSRNAHSVSRNGNFKWLNSHFIIVYIIFPGFYPLNSIVLDKNRLFYPVQRVYWIKSCILPTTTCAMVLSRDNRYAQYHTQLSVYIVRLDNMEGCLSPLTSRIFITALMYTKHQVFLVVLIKKHYICKRFQFHKSHYNMYWRVYPNMLTIVLHGYKRWLWYHDINIKAFTWRFVLDASKLRNFQVWSWTLQRWMLSGCVLPHPFYWYDLWRLICMVLPCCVVSVEGEMCIHIGVGFEVARSTILGSAKASKRGTGNKEIPRF